MDTHPSSQPTTTAKGRWHPHLIVADNARLSFISFWRAAALVLAPVFSSAFFAPGIAERVIGKTAPWFIAAVMVFSGAVSAIYIESSSILRREGYHEVKSALGAGLAKISVSVLVLDYLLMGPIRAVAGGQFICGFINESFEFLHINTHIRLNATSAVLALMFPLYFWWYNVQGVRESSQKALRILQITTVMMVVLIVWCLYTVSLRHAALPPFPYPRNLKLGPDAMGWFYGIHFTHFVGLIAVFVGLGHSVLALSGEESLAQIYREIEHPKLPNLKKTCLVIFVYSLVFTTLVSFVTVMIIPDDQRQNFLDNLVGGLTMNVEGPFLLRWLFTGLMAVGGFLVLASAVNTAIVGLSGLLNRISEDGLLPDWFRRQHPRYGTTYRTINLVVLFQILLIVVSRGDILTLANVYAVCLIWSLVARGIVVMRFRTKEPRDRQFRVPPNLKIGKTEIPLGLGVVTSALFAVGTVILFTQKTGTILATALVIVLTLSFIASERINLRRSVSQDAPRVLTLAMGEDFTAQTLGVRPGNILVALLDYNTIYNFGEVLDRVNPKRQDVIGLHVRIVARDGSERANSPVQEFLTVKEQELLNLAFNVAETKGRTVQLAVVAAEDIWDAIIHAAQSIQSSTIVLGIFPRIPPREEFRFASLAWERLPPPKPQLTVEIFCKDSAPLLFSLGPHAPRLTVGEIELLHDLWKCSGEALSSAELDHHDIVHFALLELKRSIEGAHRDEVLRALREHLARNR